MMLMEFSKRYLLDALGLQRKQSFFLIPALAGFGAGCLVGAAVAFMVTPKSGPELRSNLREQGRNLFSRKHDKASTSMS
jgi:hypothetical protein